MKSLFLATGLLSLLVLGACTGQPVTTVIVENNTAYPLDVSILYDDNQNLPEDVLEETGTAASFVIPPNSAQPFTQNCDNLQIVRVSGDLQVVGDIGPSKTSNVYRDGSDFGCQGLLTFTFTTQVIPTTLDLEVDIK